MRSLTLHIIKGLSEGTSCFDGPRLVDLFNGAVVNHLIFGYGLDEVKNE
jgi:hypothetical protein